MASAQEPVIRGIGRRVQQAGGQRFGSQGGGADSVKHRTNLEDSITISYHYLDSTRAYKMDSSVSDFYKRFPIKSTDIFLGNIGNASRSILFSPSFTSGFDPGFHSFDRYKLKLENVRYFNVTRPYTEINYLLGTRVEQIIELVHTQNIKPNWNAGFQYRLINSPGFFKNQRTNHNNYLFHSWFQSVSRRYNNYLVILENNLQSAESGGIKKDSVDYLSDPIYKDRFNIPTEIGGDPEFGRDFFSTIITTGSKYSEFSAMVRQQFDFGRKDSIVTDSTIIPLYYPSLRFEHTFQYDIYKYKFQDYPNSGTSVDYVPDSGLYANKYGVTLNNDTFYIRDKWKDIINDFSIYQFPDSKNQQQFIRMGITLQNLNGQWASGQKTFFNLWGHAEYRNKTKNQKWDLEANGKLYFTGLNSGDYKVYASIERYAGRKLGYLKLGFENASRTPSFIFDDRSSFYLMDTVINFKKENNTHLFASYYLPVFQMRLTGHYYLMTNYTYITDYTKLNQESSLFNLLQVSLEKTFRLGGRWYWHLEAYMQQLIGNGPVHVPLLFTRNRLAYEGSFGFRNLDIALGIDMKYHTAYKADGYSPLLGQFYFQDSVTIRNQLPDIAAYINFRIKSIKIFVRGENLNSMQTGVGGFGFTRNNLVAPGYALPGLQFRLGLYWGFVN